MKRKNKKFILPKNTKQPATKKLKNIPIQKPAEETQPTHLWQLENVFDAIEDVAFLLNAKMEIEKCNKATKNLTGKPYSELIGYHCWEIMHGTSKPIEGCPVQKMLETRRRETKELKIGERWFNVVADPFMDGAGRIVGAVHIVSDITRRKRAENALQQSFKNLQKMLEGTIRTVSKIVETRDPYTAGHQQQVAKLSSAIAKEMGLSVQQINVIQMASLIHDLGKIYIPTEILSKPRKLNEIEFELIKAHTQAGYDILKTTEFLSPVAEIVLQHHERMDGSGYPQGLSSEDIILEAKIVGVADVVEAMSSHRPYRPALGIDKALEEISKKKGILYDPQVVDVCLKLFDKKELKVWRRKKGKMGTEVIFSDTTKGKGGQA